MRKNFVRTIASAALALALAACSGGNNSTGSGTLAGPAAVTPASLSSALGCPRPPGDGSTVEGAPGLSYQCVFVPSADPLKVSRIVFVIFQSQGEEDIWSSQYHADHGSGPDYGQLAVLGPLWAVWGTDQATIAKAVNLGGKLV